MSILKYIVIIINTTKNMAKFRMPIMVNIGYCYKSIMPNDRLLLDYEDLARQMRKDHIFIVANTGLH